MYNCCIVVPIYKEDLEKYEEISLIQLIKVLNKYPIVFIAPNTINIKNYLSFFNATLKPKFEFFDESYFSSTVSYSQLLLKKEFYQRFKKYKFMLIYQLDAFVFRNELDYWCNLNYDYIGAPWVEFPNQPDEKFITGVGNGGFCLRNISSMLRFLDNLRTIEILNNYLKFNFNGRIRYLFRYLIRPLCNSPDDSSFIKHNSTYEDQFICRYSKAIFDEFLSRKGLIERLCSLLLIKQLNVANLNAALAFSLEWEPERQIGMNNNNLPFGCHAWQKNLHFWKPYFEELGYDVSHL